MILIIAVDNNFSIGINGDMLFHLKTDLKRFKDITSGHIMIMGRKTLESLPNGNPLPDRTHIVLTRDKKYRNHDSIVVNHISEIMPKVKELNPNNEKEVFLIGGGDLVEQMLDECEYAYITKVDKSYQNFDTAIPNLEKLSNWELIEKSEIHTEIKDGEVFEFTYNVYKNNNIKS